MRLVPDNGAIPDHCAVAVVGAGLAGLALVRELEQRGVSNVLVLEAGPAAELRHVNIVHSSERALRAWLEPATDQYFRQRWVSETPPHYTNGSGLRQRLGGRSLYWYGITLPIEPWALVEPWWPASVVADLTEAWHGGPSLYERIERELRDWRHADDRDPLLDESLTAQVGSYRLRATPRAIRRSPRRADRWHAYSPLDHWRDPDTGEVTGVPNGIRFVAEVEVLNVMHANGAARGVVVRSPTGDPREIRCDLVVLAAGTLENSRLAAQALVEVGAAADGRLTGLADHIVQGIFVRLERPHVGRLLSLVAPGSYFTECEVARSNLFLDLQVLPAGGAVVELQLTGEQMPSDESHVTCEPSERFPWPVRVRTATAPEDVAVIAAQQEILCDAWSELARIAGFPASAVEFADYNNPQRTNAFLLPDSIANAEAGAPSTWSSFLGTEDHEGGTLPLGRVLTSEHEFQSIPGLFAAGPSTFPRLGAANPALTTLALAQRLAAKLSERLAAGARSPTEAA